MYHTEKWLRKKNNLYKQLAKSTKNLLLSNQILARKLEQQQNQINALKNEIEKLKLNNTSK